MHADSSGNGHRLKKLNSRPNGYLKGVRGSQIKKSGKDSNSWIDRDQIWHTYAYSSGNGHELKINPLIPEGHGGGGLGGHQFINLGKLPNHCDDRDQIWHTPTDALVVSRNGHRLKMEPLEPQGEFGGGGGSGVTNSKMWKRCH